MDVRKKTALVDIAIASEALGSTGTETRASLCLFLFFHLALSHTNVIGLKKNARKRTAYVLIDVQKKTSLLDSRRFRYKRQVAIASEALGSTGNETRSSQTG
ncbi:hypothetical protein OROMI_017245 [Orobanche minor]